MKKLHLLRRTLLLFALIVGCAYSGWADTWEKVTDYSNLSTSDTYVIAGNIKGGDTWYSLKNNQVTSATNLPHGSTLTIVDNKITSTVSNNETWVLESTATTGAFYIKSTKGAYYLQNAGATSCTINSKSNTDNNNQWKIHHSATNSSDKGATALYNVGQSRLLAAYGTSDWRCYASTNYANIDGAEVVLYKKVIATGEATTVTIDATGITNTDVASGTDAGSLSAVVKDASSNVIASAPVTWTSSKPEVATINETTGAVTLIKKGSTTITANYAGVADTYLASSNTYVLNVANSNANDGSAAHPFTPSEAIDALNAEELDAETDYYVTGIISKVGNLTGTALTYWISDDGTTTNQVQCYKGKGLNGADFESAKDLELGDIATVKGKLTIYNTTTYEFTEGSVITSLTQRTAVNLATLTISPTSLVVGSGATATATATIDVPACTTATYTYESLNEDIATCTADGVISPVAKGEATIKVTLAIPGNDANYKLGTVKTKVETITIANPSHTASFSINGVIDDNDNTTAEEGEDITFPADPAAISGKVFAGWTTAAISGTQNDAPATLVTEATMGDADVTYYAVFAKATTGTTTVTDVLNRETTGITGSAYTSWSGKTATSSAVYAGQSAGSNSAIQLRSSGGLEGVITTASGGKAKKVTVVWESHTSNNRTLDVYGKNTAYSTSSDLYSSDSDKQGTKLGSIVYGIGTELTITGDYAYIGLRSKADAMYLTSISIDWETTGTIYSAYCTTVIAEPAEPVVSGSTVTLTTTANMAGWRTYNNNTTNKYSVGANTKVYYASATATDKVTLTEIEGGVPAETVVILHKSVAESDGTYLITLTEDNDATITGAPGVGDNKLSVTTGTTDLSSGVYRLGFKTSDGVGFYKYSNASAPEGIIYIESLTSANFLGLDFGETTDIKTLDNLTISPSDHSVYDLSGRQLSNSKWSNAQMKPGLYIVNGRKVVVK